MSKSTARQATGRIEIRCSEEDAELIRKKAKAAGVTTSELMRRAALGRKIVTRTDAKLMAQLLQTAGLLKHLYNQMRDDMMSTELSLEFSQTLRELKAAVIALDLDSVMVGE